MMRTPARPTCRPRRRGATIVALNCDVLEAVRRAREIAGDRDVQIIGADIARQALAHETAGLLALMLLT